jgi:hypothetical protein
VLVKLKTSAHLHMGHWGGFKSAPVKSARVSEHIEGAFID